MFSRLLAGFKKPGILKNLMVLVSGSASAQLIGVLAAPLLSRLYTPEEFGVLGYILAVAGVISVVASLKYELALVLEKDDNKAQALQKLCLIILVLVTAVSGVGLASAPFWIESVNGDTGLARVLPWAIPMIFLTGLFNILNSRLNRERKYKTISTALVAQRLSAVGVQIVLGFCGAAALGLILGNVIGAASAAGVILMSQKAILLRRGDTGQNDLRVIARDHYRFAAYSAPQNLLNALSQNLPVYLLGFFYGMETVGAYWFAMRLLQLPATLVGQAVRQLYYKEAADLADNLQELRALFIKTTLLLAGLIAVPVAVIFLWGPYLFELAFGKQWQLAGEFSRWMILWVGVLFVNSPAVSLFNVFHKQRHFAIYDFLLLTCRLAALLVGGLSWGSVSTIAAYSAVGVVFNVYVVAFWWFRLGQSEGGTTS